MLFNTEKPNTSGVNDLRGGDLRKQLNSRGRPYDVMQLHVLLRLARLLSLRREHAGLLSMDDWRARLLTKATYSTYCDCVGAGVGDDARTLFQQESTEPRR